MQTERSPSGTGSRSWWMGFGILMAIATGPAEAQGLSGSRIDLPMQQARTGIELDLELHAREAEAAVSRQTTRSLLTTTVPELRVGETVEVCFRSTKPGYVTLWSRTAGNPPVRIYPNAFSHSGAEALAEAVPAVERVCVGNDDRFRLRVTSPSGVTSTLYLHWTPEQAEQLPADAFPAIGRGSSVAEEQAGYASTTLEFRVIE